MRVDHSGCVAITDYAIQVYLPAFGNALDCTCGMFVPGR